jgi:hypothetical protein
MSNRTTIIANICIILTLIASGLTGVLAAALCSHSSCRAFSHTEPHSATKNSEDGSHCSSNEEPSNSHRSGAAYTDTSIEKSFEFKTPDPSGSCSHCFSRSESRAPYTIERITNTVASDLSIPVTNVIKIIPQTFFFPSFYLTRAALPGRLLPKYILFSLFLI